VNYQQDQKRCPTTGTSLFISTVLAATVNGTNLPIGGLEPQRNYGVMGPGGPVGPKLAVIEES